MKTKLNISTVVLALFGFIAVQTATAQAPNPHPAHEALKGLQPFIGNWAGEFDSEGGFEGLDNSGRTVSGTQKVRWLLNKTAFQITWDDKFKDDGKHFSFGNSIITLDPVSKKLICHSFGYDGGVYWTGKGVVVLKDKVLHFDMVENTINKTNTKYQATRRKSNRNTILVQAKNLVQNGKNIGDRKEGKLTRVPFKKKPAQSGVSAGEAEKITEVLRKLSDSWGQSAVTKDTAFLKSIWADDFSYIGADGTVRDEKANLALYASSTDTYTSARLTAFNVRVYGKNFAVTDGDDRYVGKDKDGKPFEKKGRFTNVWIRKNGKWQVVAGHGTWLK
jgi:hypothetical protein